MDIHVSDSVGRPIPMAHVESRMRKVLSRLPCPVSARISFRDVNGPKGGDDIACAVLVELPRQPTIRIERLGRTPRLAFDATYGRIVRLVERDRQRRQNSRRHPKKYYAARRVSSAAG